MMLMFCVCGDRMQHNSFNRQIVDTYMCLMSFPLESKVATPTNWTTKKISTPLCGLPRIWLFEESKLIHLKPSGHTFPRDLISNLLQRQFSGVRFSSIALPDNLHGLGMDLGCNMGFGKTFTGWQFSITERGCGNWLRPIIICIY